MISEEDIISFLKVKGVRFGKSKAGDPTILLNDLSFIFSREESDEVDAFTNELIRTKDILIQHISPAEKTQMLIVSIMSYVPLDSDKYKKIAESFGLNANIVFNVSTTVSVLMTPPLIRNLCWFMCSQMGIEVGSPVFYGVIHQANLL